MEKDKLDERKIKKKIEIAKKIAENEEEYYRKEIFAVILNKLLNELPFGLKEKENSSINISPPKISVDSEFPKKRIAEKLQIKQEDVGNLLEFVDNSVILIRKIKGKTRAKRQLKALLMIAYGFKYGLNKKDKLNSDLLSLAAKNSGVEMEHIENAFTRLRTRRLLIKEKKGGKFNILTPKGDEEAKKFLRENGG